MVIMAEEADPPAYVHLHLPKTKTTKAKWAAYTPIWIEKTRKWKNWRIFASYEAAKRYADSISPPNEA